MKRWNHLFRVATVLVAFLFGMSGVSGKDAQPILFVVLDPLAKELACACVKGYGQRDYRKLTAKLESALKQPVSVEFSDDLTETLKLATPGQEVIVAGEQSRVAQDSKKAGLKSHPICELTDPDGGTSIVGSFVVRAGDSAKELKDISGRKLLFGLADTEQNHSAVQAALRTAGVESGIKSEKRDAYNTAALDVLDSSSAPPPVAVIPGYGPRLLEGCGSVKRGEIRVIGQTQPLPFIAVFVADNVSAEKREKIQKTLLDVKSDAKLLNAIESRDGFKPIKAEPTKPQASMNLDWPDWRGPNRDGHVPWLPPKLPETAKFVWKKAAMTGGLAGLSVSDGRLILAERDFADEHDVYRCLNADNGELIWRITFAAKGTLDYGQSPRATPVIYKGKAYLLGAFGDLRCVDVADGKVIWKRQLLQDFKAELPTWGMCSPPLVVDDMLVVNPGGASASMVALDCATGNTRWTTPGAGAAYGAFICGEFGGRRQIVGYDQQSLGGWDVKTGERLWQLVPPVEGDFNVPTPIALPNSVLVTTENNGTRLYRFDKNGRIISKPAAEFPDLSPDTSTPVVVGERVIGADTGLHCLDLKNSLKPVWSRDIELGDYATLMTDGERVLVVTLGGELILLDAKGENCAVISRLRVFTYDVEVYSHPALVGTRLYVRGGPSVACVDLDSELIN